MRLSYVRDILSTMGKPHCIRAVDPAFADNGKLYPIFDEAYVDAMRTLVGASDVLLPNITEACYLTGIEYRETYDEAYIDGLVSALVDMGARSVVLTGVSYSPDTTGVVTYHDGKLSYYSHTTLTKRYLRAVTVRVTCMHRHSWEHWQTRTRCTIPRESPPITRWNV